MTEASVNPKTKVVLIQRIFAGYRKPVFDQLAKEFRFTLLHGENEAGIQAASSEYSMKTRTIQYHKNETAVYLHTLPKLMRKSPDVVIHEFAIGIVSLPLTWMYCRLFGKKFCLWSHGYDRKKGFHPESSWADKSRLWWMKRCDALILYGENDKALLSKHIPSSKIFVARNTLDTRQLLSIRTALEEEGRDAVKKRLGFTTEYNLVFIGRLLADKYPQMLIEALDYFPPELRRNTTIHFVGDGPLARMLNEMCRQKSYQHKVKFHGKIHDDLRTGAFLFASDLMVMPGYVGLSVNHAFCFQCPVLTFEQGPDGPFHSPEEAYLKDGITGFRVQDQTSKALARKIVEYLGDLEQQQKMRAFLPQYVERELGIEHMVKGVTDSIRFLSLQKRNKERRKHG